MLQFDETTTRLLDEAYLGADFAWRRRANFDALAPRPGESLLDLGCGNGLLTLELSRALGETGRVIGVDPSAAMLSSARTRCEGRANVVLQEGLAGALPLKDASVDGAVSVQVFEYVPDLESACADLFRVLRPGGRLVLGDMHFATYAWYSDDPQRMARMQVVWDDHLEHRALLECLPGPLMRAGFRVVDVRPLTLFDNVLRPDGLARMMLLLMPKYAVDNGLMHPAEAEAWAAEQHALAADGRFCFALTHFVVIAAKP